MQDYEPCFGFLEKASRAPSAEYLPKLPEKILFSATYPIHILLATTLKGKCLIWELFRQKQSFCNGPGLLWHELSIYSGEAMFYLCYFLKMAGQLLFAMQIRYRKGFEYSTYILHTFTFSDRQIVISGLTILVSVRIIKIRTTYSSSLC